MKYLAVLTLLAALFVGLAQAHDVARATYRALASVTMAERRMIWQTLSAELRSGVWRVHLSYYIEQHAEKLSEEQNAVLQDILAAVSDPALFDVKEPLEDVPAPILRLRNELLRVFTYNEAIEIFAHLGGAEPEPDKPTGGGSGQTAKSRPDPEPDPGCCDCSGASSFNFCDITAPGMACTGTFCAPTIGGCGELLLLPCNKLYLPLIAKLFARPGKYERGSK